MITFILKTVGLKVLFIAFVMMNQLNLSAADFQNHRYSPSIRSVDFGNFTHPWVSNLKDRDVTQLDVVFTLRNGVTPGYRNDKGEITGRISGPEKIFESVSYGDVTGDEAEEAVVILSASSTELGSKHIFYVYTLKGNEPVLLLALSTIEHKNISLHEVKFANGNLVVNVLDQDRSAQNPDQNQSIVYKWNGSNLMREGKE